MVALAHAETTVKEICKSCRALTGVFDEFHEAARYMYEISYRTIDNVLANCHMHAVSFTSRLRHRAGEGGIDQTTPDQIDVCLL